MQNTKSQPKNWHVVKLRDVANVLPGFAFKSSEFKKDGDIPVVKIKNITDDLNVSIENGEYLDESALNEKTEKYLINNGDILVAMTGATAGKVGKFRSNKKALLNQRVAKISPKNIDANFLWILLGNKDTINLLYRLADGAAQPNMSGGQIENLEFKIPARIETQKQIADVLSAYDDLIENNTKRIKILEQIAQAIYKEWFVHFRFPGHEKVKMVDSKTDFGEIPERWEVRKLGDNINILRGKNITKDTVVPGKVPVVAGGIGPAYFHNKANVEGPAITVSASGANSGYINLYHEDIWASDCSYINKNATPFVYYYFLLLKGRQIEVTGLQRGSAQPHVYPQDLARLLIVNPPEELLRSFEENAKSVFGMLKNFQLQNQELRQARDLLLPKLVGGEIKV